MGLSLNSWPAERYILRRVVKEETAVPPVRKLFSR
jgi:hypothetical protein